MDVGISRQAKSNPAHETNLTALMAATPSVNFCWWACSDSNREPKHYECSALTIELQARQDMISEATAIFNSRTEKLKPPLVVICQSAARWFFPVAQASRLCVSASPQQQLRAGRACHHEQFFYGPRHQLASWRT